MADREPTETRNLDRYGGPAIPWRRAREVLESGPKGPLAGFFLGTVGPDGRPHAAGVGAVWFDGDLYFTSGPSTRKSRNLATNPACTVAVKFPAMDLTFEGAATSVTEPSVLEQVAAIYRDLGWPAQVAGDAFVAPYSAPSAGSPPWCLYRFTFHTVIGLSTMEPNGASLWRFNGLSWFSATCAPRPVAVRPMSHVGATVVVVASNQDGRVANEWQSHDRDRPRSARDHPDYRSDPVARVVRIAGLRGARQRPMGRWSPMDRGLPAGHFDRTR